MGEQSKLIIPPQWKKSISRLGAALLLFCIERIWGPIGHLPHRFPPYLLAIFLVFDALYLLPSTHFFEKNIVIKFLGIPIRNIFWFEISHAVFLKSKYENRKPIMYFSRYPLFSVDEKAPDLPTARFLHPFNIISFCVPPQLEEECVRIFSERCKNFEIGIEEK